MFGVIEDQDPQVFGGGKVRELKFHERIVGEAFATAASPDLAGEEVLPAEFVEHAGCKLVHTVAGRQAGHNAIHRCPILGYHGEVMILWNKPQLVAFGQRVKKLRQHQRWNLRELAAMLHVSATWVEDIEAGKRVPRDRDLLAFADLELRLDPDADRRRRLRAVPHGSDAADQTTDTPKETVS